VFAPPDETVAMLKWTIDRTAAIGPSSRLETDLVLDEVADVKS
jgi:hypothetical protein